MSCFDKINSPFVLLGNNQPDKLPINKAFSDFTYNLERVPLLAHHPACSYYHNHLIWLGKMPVCLGCSMMTCGIGAGLLLLPHLKFLTALPFYVLLFVGICLYIPAILQIKIQFKPYKIGARFCLGMAVVFLVYAGLWLTPWSIVGLILRLGFITEFYIVWHLTLKIRSRHSKPLCDNCPAGRFPVCSYTIPRISRLANKYFAESDGNNQEADDFVRALQSVYGSKLG
ncbi:hypothetical protein [Argonema antarcticum]|uniref:hypothetical protein n=1 Tax=Argonema antarcticum TaxID=2942763 RepID=UPI002012A629|nr:hypothetical protein [Argonema antarcticum]MCL1475766.1 hypothetical protein [Argonema antarcticum A004/B2]